MSCEDLCSKELDEKDEEDGGEESTAASTTLTEDFFETETAQISAYDSPSPPTTPDFATTTTTWSMMGLMVRA